MGHQYVTRVRFFYYIAFQVWFHLIFQKKSDHFLKNTKKNDPENGTLSLLRFKGFFPNTIANHIFENFIKFVRIVFFSYLVSIIILLLLYFLLTNSSLFESNQAKVKRVFLKLHGFRDSPVSLLKLEKNVPFLNFNKPRIFEENFIAIAIEKPNKLDCIFWDYGKMFYMN